MASRTALLLLALVGLAAFVSTADAAFCHKSGYDGVACAEGKAAKRKLWETCTAGKNFKITPGEETCSPGRPGTCSYTVVQQTPTQDDWKSYDACEHMQPLYTSTFTNPGTGANLGDAACKYDKQC